MLICEQGAWHQANAFGSCLGHKCPLQPFFHLRIVSAGVLCVLTPPLRFEGGLCILGAVFANTPLTVLAKRPHPRKEEKMNVTTLIRSKIVDRGINQAILAERAGLKNQSNVAMMLKVNNMRLNNLFALLDALDCELVIKDKVTGVENVISKE